MARATIASLMKAADTSGDVALPDGTTVKVRGLTRAERLGIDQAAPVADQEAFILAAGMVDPAMSEDDAREWQATAGCDAAVDACMEAIHARTGGVDGAKQEAAKSPS